MSKNKPVSIIDPYGIYEGQLVVLETDEETYLGVLSYPTPDTVKVSTGLSGRPPILLALDVDSITPAAGHPDVVAA